MNDKTETALLIGFGVTKETSSVRPCHLQQVNVTKYSRMDCLKTKLPVSDALEPSIICAGSASGNADSCYVRCAHRNPPPCIIINKKICKIVIFLLLSNSGLSEV